jgi:hypothetical protein
MPCIQLFDAQLLIPFLTVIHPDKTTHPRAPEAFDILKKVSTFIS